MKLRSPLVASALAGLPQAIFATGGDQPGRAPTIALLDWLRDTLPSGMTSAMAMIAVVVVGITLLTGRINWRFGATVIVGCLALSGAGAIVSNIRSPTPIAD